MIGGLLLTLSLTACSPAAPASPTLPVTPVASDDPTKVPPDLSSPGQTNCYYVWATRELPDLTENIQQAFEQVDRNIRASAYAFGEECRSADGTASFLPMETDFRVRVPVAGLDDAAVLGGWISRALSIVEAVPASEVEGTRPGRVEFEFYVDEFAALRLIVDIQRYRDEAIGLDGASIFELFRAE